MSDLNVQPQSSVSVSPTRMNEMKEFVQAIFVVCTVNYCVKLHAIETKVAKFKNIFRHYTIQSVTRQKELITK